MPFTVFTAARFDQVAFIRTTPVVVLYCVAVTLGVVTCIVRPVDALALVAACWSLAANVDARFRLAVALCLKRLNAVRCCDEERCQIVTKLTVAFPFGWRETTKDARGAFTGCCVGVPDAPATAAGARLHSTSSDTATAPMVRIDGCMRGVCGGETVAR